MLEVEYWQDVCIYVAIFENYHYNAVMRSKNDLFQLFGVGDLLYAYLSMAIT